MRREHLKRAAGFPSDDGHHDPSGPVLTLDHPGPSSKPPPPGIPQSPLAPEHSLRLTFFQGQTPAQPDPVPLGPLPLPQPLPLAHPGPPARRLRRPWSGPGEEQALSPGFSWSWTWSPWKSGAGSRPCPSPLFRASGDSIWWSFTWSTETSTSPGPTASGGGRDRRAFPFWPFASSPPCPLVEEGLPHPGGLRRRFGHSLVPLWGEADGF